MFTAFFAMNGFEEKINDCNSQMMIIVCISTLLAIILHLEFITKPFI